MTIEKSLAFIDQIPAPRVRRNAVDTPDAPTPENTDAKAGVVQSQLIAFTSNLDTPFKEAVKYSTQLAQRAADQKFNHIEQRMQWYEVYNEALQHLGWIGSDNKLTRYKGSKFEVTMENVAIELIKLAAGPNAALIADLTSATINALKGDSEVLSKLQKSSSSGASGAFDILPVMQKDDDVVMYSHAMVFEHKEDSGGFWFWSWTSSNVSLEHCANEWTFNYSHYKSVESQVKEKLGESTSKFFDSLNF
ncbi:hypothetical protein ACE1YR_01050 [Pseudomonas sp. K1(2024)]|uniref:Uncharacterized protein n=1 Tax=Pseudomonas boreofloridensis TaxID=3064348 RepID=A0ABV4Z312_9PSED|nr:hypothetical protein [Pseudomonas sp. K13]MDO7900565.1 hypothetical protein [Pseudomonas sp. K13]